MRVALFLALATSVFAQSVEVGVEGGIPITHDFTAQTLNPNGVFGLCGECGTQRTLPYLIGPAIQIHLWRFLYLHAQALYGRADYIGVHSYVSGSGVSIQSISIVEKHGIDRWEVPILLKFRLPSRHFVRPFVAAGVSLEHSTDTELIDPMPGFINIVYGVPNSATGATFGAGASFGSRRVRPSIEFRYTRWSDQPVPVNHLEFSAIQSKRDEAQILAGLMFGVGRTQPDSRGVLEGPPSERRVSLGFKGGLQLTDGLSIPPSVNRNTITVFGACFECGTARTVPYVVGPALEVRLIGSLATTAEAFYSRADYNHTFFQNQLSAGYANTEEKHIVDRWEAPLLLKYSFKMRRITVFVTAGASIQYDRDARVRAIYKQYCFTCLGRFQAGISKVILDTHSTLVNQSLVAGPTAGVGASFHAGRVHPSIEARYTYWPERAIVVEPIPQFALPPPPGPPIITSSHSQVQLLVGFLF